LKCKWVKLSSSFISRSRSAHLLKTKQEKLKYRVNNNKEFNGKTVQTIWNKCAKHDWNLQFNNEQVVEIVETHLHKKIESSPFNP
jgi:hypothetical protein